MIFRVKHVDLPFLLPWVLIDVDAEALLPKLWEADRFLRIDRPIEGAELVPEFPCPLDPGGALITAIPFEEFEVNGETFSMQRNKIGLMKFRLSCAREVDGNLHIPLESIRTLVMSSQMFTALIDKLEEMSTEIETLEISIQDGKAREGLEKDDGVYFSIERPRRDVKGDFDKFMGD